MSTKPVSQQADRQVGPMNTVGRDVPRIDAYERVTGRATYTRDIQLPGMLYARVLRSPHPHARIRSIDTSAAEALPGVRAVITHETHELIYSSGSIAGGRQYSDAAKDITTRHRYMFDNPVRFVGQPVAAVAAVVPAARDLSLLGPGVGLGHPRLYSLTF